MMGAIPFLVGAPVVEAGAATSLSPAGVLGAALSARQAYRQRIWTREHGLPDDCVLSLCQTRDGLLWIGTRKGLVCYDGIEFEIFNRAVVPGFPSDECTVLTRDIEDGLWVGTAAGLVHWAAGGIQGFTASDGLAGGRILALCQARNGDLWVGTASGLSRWRDGRFEAIPMPQGGLTIDQEVRALYEDAAGRVWFSNRLQTRRWDPQTDRIEDVLLSSGVSRAGAPRHQSQFAIQITGDALTNIWLRGVQMFHGAPRQETVPVLDIEMARYSEVLGASDQVMALLVDRSGCLWMGWEGSGLSRYRDGWLREFGRADGLSDVGVNCLLEDREGSIWIGTRSGGLNCWRPRRLVPYTTAEGLSQDDVRTVAKAVGGGVWIGTENGISLWREDQLISTPVPARLFDTRVRTLLEEPAGTLWIGTMDSLHRWQDGTLTTHRWRNEIDSNRVRVVIMDRAGVLWVGWEHGLMRFRDGQWAWLSTADGLPHDDVRALLEDRKGRLWLGTFGGGVCALGSARTLPPEITLRTAEGLSDDRVTVLHEDADGVVWAGTAQGLNRIEAADDRSRAGLLGAKVVSFDTRAGLIEAVVNSIAEDDLGHLWIGCGHGIYRVLRSELDAVAGGRVSRVRCVVYDEADGMLSGETSGLRGQPAACRLADGRLWFATAKGAIVFDPAAVARGDLPPRALIRDVVVHDEKRFKLGSGSGLGIGLRGIGRELHTLGSGSAGTPATRLAGRSGLIEIHYTAPTFRGADKVRFQHWLQGVDVGWVDVGTERVARYVNLRPGAYQFRVRAGSHFSLWGEEGASLAFSVSVPFYELWWFRPICAVVVALLAGAGVYWRVREVRRLHRLEREKSLGQERDRIARDMHDDLGARLNQLALLIGSASSDSREGLGALAREAAQRLDEIVWAVQPGKDTLDGLVNYLVQHAREHLWAAGMQLVLDLPDAIPSRPLSAVQRQNLFLACKEALHNTVKHSGADTVRITLCVAAADFTLTLADNGRGCVLADRAHAGNGLSSMQRRVQESGGIFRIECRPGQGTTVSMTLPYAHSGKHH